MCLAVLAVAIVVVSPLAAQDLAPGLSALQGTWKVTSLEVEGKAAPEGKAPSEFVIAGDQLKGLGPDMKIKVDATKTPKWIDLTFKKNDKDYPLKTIYEVAGDELTLCIPLAQVGKGFENTRPENFGGKGAAIFKAKRAAK